MPITQRNDCSHQVEIFFILYLWNIIITYLVFTILSIHKFKKKWLLQNFSKVLWHCVSTEVLTVNLRANEVIEQLTILEDTFNSKKLVTNNGVPFTLLYF